MITWVNPLTLSYKLYIATLWRPNTPFNEIILKYKTTHHRAFMNVWRILLRISSLAHVRKS